MNCIDWVFSPESNDKGLGKTNGHKFFDEILYDTIDSLFLEWSRKIKLAVEIYFTTKRESSSGKWSA